MLDILPINTNIEIIVEDDDYEGKYRSRVEDKVDRGIVVAMPTSKGIIVPLRPGTDVIITYMDQQSTYALHCRVIARLRGKIPMILLEYPNKIEKVQRRNFVRVDTNLDIEFCKYIEDDEYPIFADGTALDVSGGGARVISEENAIRGEILRVRIHLPNIILEVQATVAWVYADERTTKKRFYIGMEFKDIPEKDRDKIIKYVFDRQRELILKGVLE